MEDYPPTLAELESRFFLRKNVVTTCSNCAGLKVFNFHVAVGQKLGLPDDCFINVLFVGTKLILHLEPSSSERASLWCRVQGHPVGRKIITRINKKGK